MEGAAEQIPISNQDKAQISLGFVLQAICITLTHPEIAYVSCYRCLPMSLICNLFFQSSDTEISNMLWLKDFCQRVALQINIFPPAELYFWFTSLLPFMDKTPNYFLVVEVNRVPGVTCCLTENTASREHVKYHASENRYEQRYRP